MKVMPKKKKEKQVGHRRTGTIARMPRTLRDEINQMIDDGVPYREIIARGEQEGHKFNKFQLIG